MVLQGSQRNTYSHCSTMDWTWYNDIAFPSKPTLDESQLCSNGQTRSGQTFDCKIHYCDERSNLAFTHYGGPQKNGKLRIYVNFRILHATTKKDPYLLPFTKEVLDMVTRHKVYSFLDGFLNCH